jgi:dTDP-4-amino-4,6-dideoxygalactose transaminase
LADDQNVYHLFPVFCEQRDDFQAYLAHHDVKTVIHYPIPPHKQECYKQWNSLSLPVTERIHQQELSLPMSPAMTHEEAQEVVSLINRY